MILVDTSVLVHYLRTASPAIRQIFESVDCAICGITRAEILHGARSQEDATMLRAALDGFIQLPVEEDIWDSLGNHLALLRAKGLAMPFQDVLLATIAMHYDAELWTYDSHFQAIQKVLSDLRQFLGPMK